MAQKLNLGDLSVASSAFDSHSRMPARYTVDGEDISPPLAWTGIPEQTRSFAVVAHDPDAPLVDGFTHWVLYGIPGETTNLSEGAREYKAGTNSFGKSGYNGPAPPPGHGPHHYYFWVYALDADLDLEPGLDRRTLFEHIENHVIEQARITGIYER
jgi:Raf kinase inhibitor-like YbhB/YbcL family protein